MFGGKRGIRPNIGGINFEVDQLIQMLTGIFKIISTLVGLVSVLIHIGAHLYTDPCGVVLVDVWCDERKGWNQHERAGDQLNDVTQREGDWEEKRLFFSE